MKATKTKKKAAKKTVKTPNPNAGLDKAAFDAIVAIETTQDLMGKLHEKVSDLPIGSVIRYDRTFTKTTVGSPIVMLQTFTYAAVKYASNQWATTGRENNRLRDCCIAKLLADRNTTTFRVMA